MTLLEVQEYRKKYMQERRKSPAFNAKNDARNATATRTTYKYKGKIYDTMKDLAKAIPCSEGTCLRYVRLGHCDDGHIIKKIVTPN